jgi:hypothetical protein
MNQVGIQCMFVFSAGSCLRVTLQATLAQAVMEKAQPSAEQLRTQGTGKTVVGSLRTDAQRQSARGGRDQEAAAAAAGGKGQGGRKAAKGKGGGKGRAAAQQRQRLRRKVDVEDQSDETDDEMVDDMGSEDSAEGGDRKRAAPVGAAAGAGKRQRQGNKWHALDM